jgi:hypothetical protein
MPNAPDETLAIGNIIDSGSETHNKIKMNVNARKWISCKIKFPNASVETFEGTSC